MNSKTKKIINSLIERFIVYIPLFLVAMVLIIPFVWTYSSSLQPLDRAFQMPPSWIPLPPTLTNWAGVFKAVPFFCFLFNSFKIASIITVSQIITCSMAAYAFARLNFPGRNVLFYVYLITLMIPLQVTIIPIFVIMRILNLLDNHASLILPSLSTAFGTFFLRQFFMEIPRELEDAAKIDGAGPFRIYYQIMLPLSRPALASLAIFTFSFHWNEFFRPVIFLHSFEKMTLPLGIVSLKGYYGTTAPVIPLSAVSMALLPALIIYIFLQRYLIKGVTLTGLKV